MPASDLVWNPSSSPVFQVYGTKRKSSCHAAESQLSDANMEMDGLCKRRCMQRTEPDGLEINHNDPQLHSLHHCQPVNQTQNQIMDHDMEASSNSYSQLISVQQYYGGPQIQQVHVPPTTPQSPVDQYPTHRIGEDSMVMDLCDETYSARPQQTETEREQEAAQNQMESDYTPDHQQYRNNSLAYCDLNCIGIARPASSKVRCYCKPSWDGMMDLRPYVSDYY